MTPKDIANLLAEVEQLQRGCDCEYDYRCRNCSQIIKVKEIASDIVADCKAAFERVRS